MNFIPSQVRGARVSTVILSALLLAGRASAQPANEPSEDSFVTDGIVYSMAETNNTLYVGGLFTIVGWRASGALPISAATGLPEANYPRINGRVQAIIPDGLGGWYLGGNFTVAGGLQRSNLVHVRSDRTVNPTWNPSVAGSVATLWRSNQTLYFGGFFTNVNGQGRRYAAAVNTGSGALTGWNPDPDAQVNSIVASGTNIFIGGNFANVSGQARGRLAAVDPTTGALRSWNPNIPGSGTYVQTMLVNGGRLIVGGRFGTFAAQTRNNIASVDLSTFAVEAWNPNANSDVLTMTLGPGSLFAGGFFTVIGSSNRNLVAELDLNTGLATAWNPQLVVPGGLSAWQVNALLVHSNKLLIGGIFFNFGTSPLRPHAAMLDLTTGQPTSWDPRPNFLVAAFGASGDTIYMGGLFGAVGCSYRTNLAAVNLTNKQIMPWNPSPDYRVWSLALASNQVYFGGDFTNVNGLFRPKLASADINTGALSSWAPNPDAGSVAAVAVWSNRLYVGGSIRYNALLRTNLVEFDLTTGALTAWDPVVRATVLALCVSENTLYVGGLIVSVGGVARRGPVAFDLPGPNLKAWDPNITTATTIEDIAVYSNRVYAVGTFKTINGFNRTNFVALDANTAAVLPLVANADNTIFGVAASSNRVFLVGQFLAISNQPRNDLAALDTDTGQLLPWNPGTLSYFGQTASVIKNVLYVGGAFYQIGGNTSRGFATFPLASSGAPTILPQTLERLDDGSLYFQFTAPSVPQATVLVSSNLKDWTPAQTLPVVGGVAGFADPNAASLPRSFYRVRVP